VRTHRPAQRRRETTAAPPEVAPAPPPAPEQRVQVQWGAMTEWMDLAGMTVGEALQMLQRPYRIAPDVLALVGGRQVTREHRLAAGEELELVRLAGEKGA